MAKDKTNIEDLFSETFNNIINYVKKNTSTTQNGAKEFKKAVNKTEKKKLNKEGLYQSIQEQDTKWIYRHTSTILNSRDAPFIASFGIVCAYDNKLDLSLRAFSTILGKAPQIVESRALVAYEQGKYGTSNILLSSIGKSEISDLGKLAQSLSLLKLEDSEIKKHYKILNSSQSDTAHRVLGILFYNDEKYTQALTQFKQAWKIKKSETNLLNILAGQRRMEDTYAAKEFVDATAPYFLEATSVPSQEIIDQHIYQTALEIPELKLGNNLYKALIKLNRR